MLVAVVAVEEVVVLDQVEGVQAQGPGGEPLEGAGVRLLREEGGGGGGGGG